MSIDLPQIASAVVAAFAPFLPFLLDAGKASGRKFAEAIAEKGGEAAWSRARKVWRRIAPRRGRSGLVRAAAAEWAASPTDPAREALTRVVEEHLRRNAALAWEVVDFMGGEPGVQEVLAMAGSHVEAVVQRTHGIHPLVQRVVATGGSTVRDVRQIQDPRHSADPGGSSLPPPMESP